MEEAIEIHEIIHGFRYRRGTGTATLEAKIPQHIMGLWQELLCDIPKSLLHAGPGARPGNPGRVWDGPPDLPTPELILVSVHHSVKGKQVLWRPLPGEPWCQPGEGVPLPPWISNTVVDAIGSNWVGMVVENEAGPDSFRCMLTEKVEFFYTDDGPVASANQVWLQWDFDVLIGLFEQIRLLTNVVKMVEIVFQTGPIYGQKYVVYYGWSMTGKGYPHRLRQHHRVVY